MAGGLSEPQEHGVEPDQAQCLAVELAHLAEHVGLLDPLDDLPVVDLDRMRRSRYPFYRQEVLRSAHTAGATLGYDPPPQPASSGRRIEDIDERRFRGIR